MENGYDTVLVDNLCNSDAAVADAVEKLGGRRTRFYEADVCDAASMRRIFSENRIDAVLHFAGAKAVGESVEKPLLYYRNNIDSLLALLETMKEYGVKKLVFSSSATVYGDINTPPFTEDMPVSAVNPYGRTKLFSEEILKDAAYADKELCVALLRYFNPVGAHGSGLLGESPKGIPNNLMPRLTDAAKGSQPCINIYGDDYDTPDGTCQRDYIHVCDLAEGHAAALKKLESMESGTVVYNLGTGRPVSVKELVDAFEAAAGVRIERRICKRRAGDVAVSYADVSKAKRELGFAAKRTVEQMCESAWRFAAKK